MVAPGWPPTLPKKRWFGCTKPLASMHSTQAERIHWVDLQSQHRLELGRGDRGLLARAFAPFDRRARGAVELKALSPAGFVVGEGS